MITLKQHGDKLHIEITGEIWEYNSVNEMAEDVKKIFAMKLKRVPE